MALAPPKVFVVTKTSKAEKVSLFLVIKKCRNVKIASVLSVSATDHSYFSIRSYKIPVISGLKKRFLVLKKVLIKSGILKS